MTVAELLRLEHPQIVAVILVHLEPDQVSAVLRRFPDDLSILRQILRLNNDLGGGIGLAAGFSFSDGD